METTAGRLKHLHTLKPHYPSTHMAPHTPRNERVKRAHTDLHTPRGGWDSGGSSQEDFKKPHSLQTGWCETPKLTKKDASLRRRLLLSKSATDGKTSGSKTPGCRDSDTHGYMGSMSFDSPDMSPTGPLSYSTLKTEAMALSCRKRRLLFSQVVTSTLESGRSGVTSPLLREGGFLSEPDLNESIISGLLVPEILSVLSTPSCTPISKLDTSASEDSGFSSLGLDKSQDYSIDEVSFQDVVLPSASHSREKRRSRLDRQRRLSTLREGGSQSEEEHRAQQVETQRLKDEEVFLEATPVGAARVKLQDLSLTPALQMVHAMSWRSKRILSQNNSLEKLLRVSTLDEPIRTTLPLSGLIGRKMGLGKLDILTELSKRNLHHLLAVILKLLSPQDIYICGQVSHSWDVIILQDKKACRRRKMYEKEMKVALEMGSAAHVPDAETRLNLACRSALSSVQAQAKTPSSLTRTPVAKTLFSDECLKQCPRCQHPARCHAVRGEGICSWSDCLFHFCTSCLCSYHGSKDCAHLSTKRRSRKDVLPGSAQSKRNVRRL
uniref:ZBR-type domain-containing protein n=1 Tax=Pygocentrus nattereri TaxID=42514 RepID=A0AAR2J0H5_PYGNA